MSATQAPRSVVFHSPGPAWQPGVDFRQQPGVMDHIGHYAALQQQGKLEMGGPFLTEDSGGMMIATAEVGVEELMAFASEDPAVISGLLNFDVRPWLVAMSNQDSVQ